MNIKNLPCTLYMLTIRMIGGAHTAVILADSRTEVFNAAIVRYQENLIGVEITREITGFTHEPYVVPPPKDNE